MPCSSNYGDKYLHLIVSNIFMLLHQEHTSYGCCFTPPGQICCRCSRHEMIHSTILKKTKCNYNRYLKIIIQKNPKLQTTITSYPEEKTNKQTGGMSSMLSEKWGGGILAH